MTQKDRIERRACAALLAGRIEEYERLWRLAQEHWSIYYL